MSQIAESLLDVPEAEWQDTVLAAVREAGDTRRARRSGSRPSRSSAPTPAWSPACVLIATQGAVGAADWLRDLLHGLDRGVYFTHVANAINGL